MRIIGWNVNGIRSTFAVKPERINKVSLKTFLKEQNADIACFQVSLKMQI